MLPRDLILNNRKETWGRHENKAQRDRGLREKTGGRELMQAVQGRGGGFYISHRGRETSWKKKKKDHCLENLRKPQTQNSPDAYSLAVKNQQNKL